MVDANFQELIKPRTYNSCKVSEVKEKVPEQNGVYAWYFRMRNVLENIPTEGCMRSQWEGDDYALLYIGIAPKRAQVNGKRNSTLNERIKNQHTNGNAEGSTLRFSLGCLLEDKLGIKLCRVEPMKFDDEEKLTHWMNENALVVWTLDEKPWLKEVDFIKKASPPLNIQHNRHHPFCPSLIRIRAEARERAKSLQEEKRKKSVNVG